MKYRILFFSILAASAFSFVSCGGDEDENEASPSNCMSWATEVQDEVQAVQAAAEAYSNEQSTANCTAYKGAMQNYVDELKKFQNCPELTGTYKEQFDQYLISAQTQLDAFTCD